MLADLAITPLLASLVKPPFKRLGEHEGLPSLPSYQILMIKRADLGPAGDALASEVKASFEALTPAERQLEHPHLDSRYGQDVMNSRAVTKIRLPATIALHRLQTSGDDLDCYSVPAPMAAHDAALIITDFPGWARFLQLIRRIVTPLSVWTMTGRRLLIASASFRRI